jgi:hypothetical protein
MKGANAVPRKLAHVLWMAFGAICMFPCAIVVLGVLGFYLYPPQFEWGKDTVDSFGNGRFQMEQYPAIGQDAPAPLVLRDRQEGLNLLTFVRNWQAAGDWVYAVGNDPEADSARWYPSNELRYVTLNCRTGFHAEFARPRDAPPEHRAALLMIAHRRTGFWTPHR